jgi:UDP-N-acetylglucosamine 4,6-dehydratase/5-epimerase
MEIRGSVILITGGTGSFGARVAVRLLEQGPAQIRIFSRDEKKQWDMQRRYPQFRYLVGDVRDPNRIQQAMEGVDLVFHAAALKQVPSCEEFPLEAVKTNVLGSQNCCEAARACGVKTFVALSTDKAVKPVNAMGLSKALMEKIVCTQNQYARSTLFCCVRYGNVMGSRGSVIPLFRRQIEAGQPVTVTVPEMTRFLMTLDESVELVFHAMTQAHGGEVFVRKAPASRADALARAVCAKYSPLKEEHPLSIVGIRAGEKIHEILVNEYEMQRSVEAAGYFTIYPEYRTPPASNRPPLGEEYTSANTRQLNDVQGISQLLEAMGETESYA